MANEDLDKLIAQARTVRMTAAQREEQRRSFVWGNTYIENSRLTKELLTTVAERGAAEAAS
ncbi:MAG: hypothetical protein R3B97_05640 [Dehalococcoidia bacterium]|nr:hypothetical protein [Dehalococcoidia bacterium]